MLNLDLVKITSFFFFFPFKGWGLLLRSEAHPSGPSLLGCQGCREPSSNLACRDSSFRSCPMYWESVAGHLPCSHLLTGSEWCRTCQLQEIWPLLGHCPLPFLHLPYFQASQDIPLLPHGSWLGVEGYWLWRVPTLLCPEPQDCLLLGPWSMTFCQQWGPCWLHCTPRTV